MDEKIGYKNPPRHSRFRPGQSGNPAGRPRGKVSLIADLADELAELVPGTALTKSRAIVKNLVAAGIGDAKTGLGLIPVYARFCSELDDEPEHNSDPERLYLRKLADQEQQLATDDVSSAPPAEEV